ncbi:polymorphic toxin type 17 domain-containing protein [Streptomyces griseorubiginosus]|uniref:polymorphic toxin type 17 domain-containing protein n=1 Tax=Streptomyces griseorubiginosus TaxID=67304 RepID=UPI001AD7754D|nr:polymorphic toxin type 17 domain-containing protein [Streptomyces griseorubiginosus]MBO4257498.1 RHS repeat protein [Streptomyces griseorubiginosus]
MGWDDPTILTLGVGYYLKVSVSADPGTQSDPQGTGCATGWSAEAKSPTIVAQGPPVNVSESETYGCGCLDTTGRMPFQGYLGDPVNTATGAQAESAVDAAVQAPGVAFSMRRTYSSNNTTSGMLGRGWSSPYDAHLLVSSTKAVYVADSGARITFAKDATSGVYTASSLGVTAALTGSGGSGFTLTTSGREKLTFDGSGKLSGWQDAAGAGLSFSYSGTDLATVKDAGGHEIKLTVDPTSHLLQKIDLPGGQSVAYGYDNGLLTSVKGTDGGTFVYGYGDNGLLTSITDPAGQKVMRTEYDDNGLVTHQTDADGKTTTFSRAPLETDYQDANGGIWSDLYSGSVLRNRIDPLGNITSYQYDAKLRLTDVTDPLGVDTVMTYNSAGDMLSRTRAGVSESWTYDTSHNVTSYTDGRGAKTSYVYDANQHLKSADGPAGKTSFTYNAAGRVDTATSPRGKVTSFGYDDQGNLTSRTQPSGAKTTYTYDSAGRLLTSTSPRGNVSGANPASYRTTYVYDSAGRLQKVTDPLGNVTSYEYDANGNQTKVTDAAGGVTAYAYDTSNRVTSVTAPDGSSESTTYDAAGHALSQTDATGGKTTYGYDKAGRLVSTTPPNGNVAGVDPSKYTTTYGYDADGNRTSTVDPTGALTTTEYDSFGRPTKVTDPMKDVTVTAYDGDGNVSQVTDPLTKVTKYTYTPSNLPLTVTDQLGKVTTYGYDADGNRTSVKTPLGNKTTYAYDDDGRLASTTDPRGNAAGAPPDNYTTWYEYNPDGYQTATWDGAGAETDTTYDANGNITWTRDPESRVTTYGYDNLGRLTKVNAFYDGATSYTYDAAGNVKTRTDANNHITTYGYDAARRLTSVTDPLSRKTSYAYDADGNLSKTTTPRGSTSQTWDARDLLTKTDYSDSTPDVSYQYDAAGRMTLRNNGVLSEDFGYYADGRLKNSRGYSYAYDAAGHMLSRTLGDGNTIGYTYDDDGRTKTMTADSKTTSYAYDAAGNLTTTTLPNTETETRQYTLGRLTGVTSAKAGTTVTSTSLTLSPGGLPIHVNVSRTGVGSGGWDLTYDSHGRLASGCAPRPTDVGCPAARATTYTYDRVGNRLTSTLGTTSTSYSYDDADELMSSTTGSTTTAYAYDGEGNQTKAGADTYTYDLAGQISAATVAGTSYTYTHDATGNQLTTSKSGTVQGRLDWDLNASTPQLATEYDSTGAVKQSYRYDPLGQPTATKTSSGALFFYHHDTQGSPVDVTGSTGTLYQRWSYDPYGTRTLNTVTTGAPTSTPAYTGARYETTTGNLDLHARQYTSTTGRFTSTDPLTPDRNSPYTSAYAYAEDAPTVYTDPSGMCSITTQLKDVFTGNWGWNNNCAKEDRESATKPPAVQAAKNFSDTATRSLINTTGQASLGFLDGLTFGTYSYFSGAQITCPTVYNVGLYATMVPFPIEGGGKRLAAEGAEVLGRDVVQTGMKGLIKRAQLPIRGRIRYVPPSGTSISAGLPRAPKGGFIDKFGNIWEKGPSRTPGEPFEWDVQLSRQGRAQLGWASRDGSHLNVSLNGRITHK